MNGLHYTVRSAIDKDAADLSELRLQIEERQKNMNSIKVIKIMGNILVPTVEVHFHLMMMGAMVFAINVPGIINLIFAARTISSVV
ncbi:MULTISPECIES: hypothetical protein [Paenibacillus]|uniref:hypothetical protein n=1 Tax=Paenibacillus TaxID=44249 RepID=UPI00129B42F0|nr:MULTISPECIES: hypothetical protein [Paenibacillus]KAE8561046.1 hypothetical protein BJH92_05985 [Paenibacillus polymyxa]KAF6584729.1 hypothetical protein G9G57_06075 [Paenibacillus sp. EKM211P]MCJ1220508.1 hypothetical protein [Paenibacillus polymyxa]